MAQKKYSTEEKLDIVERYENGESRNSISKKTGISTLTIKSWIDRKNELIETVFDETRNGRCSAKKKRYSDRFKKLVTDRVENGESTYRVSRELCIPYLTVKNWVLAAQNAAASERSANVTSFKTNEADFPDAAEEAETGIFAESSLKSSREDALFRTVNSQNAEISELRARIVELEDEIDMLKKAAILLSKKTVLEETAD